MTLNIRLNLMRGGVFQPVSKFATLIDDRKGRLSASDILKAIKNVNKAVSVPYDMLGNAQMNMSRHDTRAAVLNCATAIEVMLKKRIIAYFDSNAVPTCLKDHVLKKADGYRKLKDLCKSLSISLAGMPNVQVDVMEIRHRVIHGGRIPTFEEANTALECTRKTLAVMKEPMFE